MKIRLPRYFPWIFFWLALVGPALGWLGRWFWFFDLFSHFRLQQVGFLLLSLPFLAGWKKQRLLVLTLVMLVLAGKPLLIYWPGPAASGASPAQGPVRVLYANVNVANPHHDTIVSVLMKDKPDVLVISEISAPLYDVLKPHLEEYPYREVVPRNDCFGLGVFSRLPVVSMDIRFLGEARLPSIRCVIGPESQGVVLWATHPVPPMGQREWTWRNEQVKTLVGEIMSDPRPAIVVGDLNMAPWCSWFGMFKAAGLKDSAEGMGLVPTWPFYFPDFMRIPLDHILVSTDIPVLQRDVLSLPGSDHRPVSVLLGL